MKKMDFSWGSKAKGPSNLLTIMLMVSTVLLSGCLFIFFNGSPLSLAPILVFSAWRVLPHLGKNGDQVILLILTIICFILDDFAFKPWDIIEPITETLGIVLFKSFGLNGLEVFALSFSVLLFIITKKEEKIRWRRYRLFEFWLMSNIFFFTAVIGGLVGLSKSGSLEVVLIQIRYLYLTPFWVFIGFAVLRDPEIVQKFFLCLTVVIVLKGIQSIITYFLNRDLYFNAEFVYEHYYSAYDVLAMVCLLSYFYRFAYFPLRMLLAISFIITFTAYLLDDRRTSFVAVVFASVCLIGFLPRSLFKIYGRRIFTTLGIVVVAIAGTWNLPSPFGLGSLYRSFGAETGDGGPSYRDLENGNLLQEVSLNPVLGKGFGTEFDEVYVMPSIGAIYSRYKMMPHNSLLSSWCYGGPLAISALTFLFVCMISLAGRLIFDEDLRGHRFIGIVCLFYFVQYFAFTFGDIGFQVNRSHMLGGLLLGSCYRLYTQRKMETGQC